MAQRDPETNPAAFLGGELRRARVSAGFNSQDAFDNAGLTRYAARVQALASDSLIDWVHREPID